MTYAIHLDITWRHVEIVREKCSLAVARDKMITLSDAHKYAFALPALSLVK
jgi:hypothetical protein